MTWPYPRTHMAKNRWYNALVWEHLDRKPCVFFFDNTINLIGDKAQSFPASKSVWSTYQVEIPIHGAWANSMGCPPWQNLVWLGGFFSRDLRAPYYSPRKLRKPIPYGKIIGIFRFHLGGSAARSLGNSMVSSWSYAFSFPPHDRYTHHFCGVSQNFDGWTTMIGVEATNQ